MSDLFQTLKSLLNNLLDWILWLDGCDLGFHRFAHWENINAEMQKRVCTDCNIAQWRSNKK